MYFVTKLKLRLVKFHSNFAKRRGLIVARNNVNVVADELANKSYNSLYLFNNWYLDSTMSMHINAVLCVVVPSAQIGGFPMKLAPNVFDFTVDTPSSPESAY